MAELKNINLVSGLLTDRQKAQIEAGALLVRRHTAITFKVKEVDQELKKLTVQAVQEKLSGGGEYLDRKSLVERAKGFFAPFFPEWNVVVNATPYDGTPVDVVTPEWVAGKLSSLELKQKDIIDETGVDLTNLSAWISGKRPMSQPVKAMFYYYFLAKNSK